MLSAKLMRNRITSLERANKAATKRRQRKKKRIQKHGVLTKGAGEDVLAQKEADQQIEREQRQGGEQSPTSTYTRASVQLDITSRREVLYRLDRNWHCDRIRYVTPCCLNYCSSSFYLEYDFKLFANELVPPTAPQIFSVREAGSTKFALIAAIPAVHIDFARRRHSSTLRCGAILQIHLGSMALE
ncbi:hypothetical protein EK21DRAFT_60544 [Setomelanomma holmii]|uniref:Uncharacterized protein n=1 Tax=Setomelanomma holmii TaxID=210430 RepID=A0A9P4LP28_9PLEO|nr:hypothetical protein EK21DRAFT_60544 [Setomelanomma holmii]